MMHNKRDMGRVSMFFFVRPLLDVFGLAEGHIFRCNINGPVEYNLFKCKWLPSYNITLGKHVGHVIILPLILSDQLASEITNSISALWQEVINVPVWRKRCIGRWRRFGRCMLQYMDWCMGRHYHVHISNKHRFRMLFYSRWKLSQLLPYVPHVTTVFPICSTHDYIQAPSNDTNKSMWKKMQPIKSSSHLNILFDLEIGHMNAVLV